MKKWFILLGSLLLGLSACFIYMNLPYEFKYEEGELREEVTSPSGRYTAQYYDQMYGGAAGGVNLFVNIVSHLEDDAVRTVYFSDANSYFHIHWLNDDQLAIRHLGGGDQSIVLTIGQEIYDGTGKACRNYAITKHYTCYSKKSL
ncbi:DUF5412 family protein [Paenibacillus paeoniae]|uniref:Lipoprotein n=1 Tax=Paenibacillus paeoniae TaxID=2292705 RepID=A0A371PHR4_9BACL|nr:DUF5412 family protein [Paenibacillus paeoniae]REK75068.1 hypothetical protein DX130_15650 [Paenibacillus paeoniae]